MGYPTGIREMLQIIEGQENFHNSGIVLEAIQQYRLFAFILHDKVLHKQFDEELSQQFEVLDYTTGKYMMFFAIVDPPAEWKKQAKKRSYFQALESELALWQMTTPENSMQSQDPQLTVKVLRNNLDLKADKPIVVITDNLRSPVYYYFYTDADSLARQFGELAFVSHRMENGFQPDVLERLKDRLEIFSGKPSMQRTVNQAILDTLYIIDIGQYSPYKPSSGRAAMDCVRKLLGDAQAQLAFAKNSLEVGDGDEDKVSELAIKMGELIALFDQHGKSPRSQLNISTDLLEPSSQIMLRTSRSLEKLFLEEERGTVSSLTRRLDTSPAVITISKIFEVEVNLSIGHWIRHQLQIDLPRYYNKFQPNVIAKVEETDFNRQNREHAGEWLPPAMGQTEIAFSRLKRDWGQLPATREELDFLVKQWIMIRDARNRAAHTGVLAPADISHSIKLVNELNEAAWFEKMAMLKRKWRGEER